MNENDLWTWLRDVVLPLGHYSRIESANTAPGHPDVAYQIDRHCSGTLELKYQGRNAKIPFRDSKKGMRDSQLAWIKKNLKHKGNVYVVAETVPDIFVIHGNEAEEINGSTRENLHKISIAVLNRDDPEKAAELLDNILRGTE